MCVQPSLYDNETKPLTQGAGWPSLQDIYLAAAYELWLVLGCFCVNRVSFEHEQFLQTSDLNENSEASTVLSFCCYDCNVPLWKSLLVACLWNGANSGRFLKNIPDRFLQIHLILVWRNIELKLRSGACLVVFRAKSARILDVFSRKITRFSKCTASVKFKPCQKDGRQTCHDQWADKRIPQKPIFDEDGWVNHISNKLTCIQLNRNL